MAMNNRIMRPRASGVKYHPEALAWRTAAIANGGIVSTATMQAVSNLCQAVDANNLRDRFVRLNLCCGDNVQAAVVPLYRGPVANGPTYGSSADYNVGPFVTGSDYTATDGFIGGDYKWLETNVDLSTLHGLLMDYNECHVSVWRLSGPSTVDVGAYDLNGCQDTGCNGLYMQAFSGSGYMASVGNTGDYSIQATSVNSDHGLHLASRSGGTPAYSFNGADQTINTTNNSCNWGDCDLVMIAHGSQYSEPDCSVSMYGSQPGARMTAYSFGLGMSFSGMRNGWYQILWQFHQAIGRA